MREVHMLPAVEGQRNDRSGGGIVRGVGRVASG